MARTWMILARVIRVPQAQAGLGEAAAMHAGAQMQHAAPAARAELEENVARVDEVPAPGAAAANNLGQPDFTVSVEPPPRVTSVTARLGRLLDDISTDLYPYIVASGPFCLLAYFATAPFFGTDLRRALVGTRQSPRPGPRHLVMVRYFRRRVGGEIAATAVRVPARPRGVHPLTNIESVGLVCDGYDDRRTYNFSIAELMVDSGLANPSLELAVFRSDRGRWFAIPGLRSPLTWWNASRKWVAHGAVALQSTVVWFDLSWGILCCDIEQEQPEHLEVHFYRLPLGRILGKGEPIEDIHSTRCIAVSGDLLRYVEIINPNQGQAARVCMWSLRGDDDEGEAGGLRWIANYDVSFHEIWSNGSYAPTRLQREVPVLAGVCPANPDVIYFDLRHRLFGVNVPERRVVDYEANQHELVNVPGPGAPHSQTGSSRYLLTWNLQRQGRGTIIGHVSPGLPDDGFPDNPYDKAPQDPKGKSKATDAKRKSSSASSSRPSKGPRIK